jgi:hypothetical protein
MILEGTGVIRWGAERRSLSPGRTLLIPASGPEVRIEPESETIVLEAFVP